MNIGEHHKHKRKRIHLKKEQFPHPNTFIRRYDIFISILGICMPILTTSQVIKIYISQNAQRVSVLAWSAYLFSSCAWLLYGIIHKEKPIMITNTISLLINFSVVIGALLYG